MSFFGKTLREGGSNRNEKQDVIKNLDGNGSSNAGDPGDGVGANRLPT
jgi:hypothetical protein